MALQDALSGDQRNAYEALNNLFSSYNLSSLAPKIFDYIQKGYSADTVSILLQDTDEYKQRFAGNEARRQAGLRVLSPSEYLSVEDSYRQIMKQGGLPPGFYDQPSDFNTMIGNDLSPTELKSRVDMASQASTLANTNYKRALEQMYGIDQSHLTAYFLDQDKALPLLQRQAQAAAIGAEALKRGFQPSNMSEEFATAGVTAGQAAQAYGQMAMEMPDYQKIASLSGEKVSQFEMERALLENNTTGATVEGGFMAESPQAKLERLASWNRARSQGARAGAQGGLGQSMSGMV
jgi:hypothetical protein